MSITAYNLHIFPPAPGIGSINVSKVNIKWGELHCIATQWWECVMLSWMWWQECHIRKSSRCCQALCFTLHSTPRASTCACMQYQMLYMLCTCLVACSDPTNVLMSVNWPGWDSFRTVNYAIMLGLDRICSHCRLLHIIDRPSVSQHLVPAHIIIPLMMPAKLCKLFQASKNTQNELNEIGSRSWTTRCAHWFAKWIKLQEWMKSSLMVERGIQIEN